MIRNIKMKKLLRILFSLTICLTCLTTDAHSEAFNLFIKSMDEQILATDWVLLNGPPDMDEDKARSIVKQVYAQSYSDGMDPYLILAMIKQESNFKQYAKSKAGAKGLLQVLPKWHKARLAGRNPYAQNVSIEVGIDILKECFDRNQNNSKKAMKCYSGNAKDYHRKVYNYRYKIAKYVHDMGKPQAILMAKAY